MYVQHSFNIYSAESNGDKSDYPRGTQLQVIIEAGYLKRCFRTISARSTMQHSPPQLAHSRICSALNPSMQLVFAERHAPYETLASQRSDCPEQQSRPYRC
jgi:hypothetical protein